MNLITKGFETEDKKFKIEFNKREFNFYENGKLKSKIDIKKSSEFYKEEDKVYEIFKYIYDKDEQYYSFLDNVHDEIRNMFGIYFMKINSLPTIEEVDFIPSTLIRVYETDDYGRDIGTIKLVEVEPKYFRNTRFLNIYGKFVDDFRLSDYGREEVRKKLGQSLSHTGFEFVNDFKIKKSVNDIDKEIERLQKLKEKYTKYESIK